MITQRLLGAALDGFERLVEAGSCSDRERLARLQDADAMLAKLRFYLQLDRRWAWLSDGQYEHVSAQVAEIGRLVGGWIRSHRAAR